MKIGIYSGSFNPIHLGHSMLAKHILSNSDIDELWLLVTPQNPLKQNSEMAINSDRFAMVKLVANDIDKVKASDYEFSLPQPTYTYTTLCRLKEDYPQHQFKLIIGSDNWLIFDKWRDSERIISEFGLLVYPRPGYDISEEDFPNNVCFLSWLPQKNVSSTIIREFIKEGKNLSEYLSSEVISYIKEHKLYE